MIAWGWVFKPKEVIVPYVKEFKNGVSLEDRAVLDPHIYPLVVKMKAVKNEQDVRDLYPLVVKLADEIKGLDKKYGYFGAFAGELNYSITTVMLELIPDIRYWVAALTTGWQERLKHEFLSHAPVLLETEYFRFKPAKMPFGTDRMFKHLTEWVMVMLACLVRPDDTEDTVDAIVGVISHLDTEMYRRIWADYEDKVIGLNGDLPQYVRWIEKIKNK